MPDVARIFVLKGALERFQAQGIEIGTPFELYVDNRCWDELLELLRDSIWKQKFYRVIYQMLEDRFQNSSLYGKEPNGTTAMKIRSRRNSRLICVEQSGGKIVIMAHVIENKTTQPAQSRRTEGIYEAIPKRTYTLVK